MPRRREPIPRARAAGYWLGGMLLLGLIGAAMVSAAVLLWEHLDVRQLSPLIPLPTASPAPPVPEAPPPPAILGEKFTAYLFESPRNRAFFPDASHYPDALRRWRKLIESVGGEVETIRSLQAVPSEGEDVLLVIPEALCLGEAEVSALRDHLASGGNLVSNWAVGARDGACEWRGWGTVSELTGAQAVRELGTREALFLAVPAGTPFSAGLDPGTRIEFRRNPALAVRVSGPRVYWADWALNPFPDETGAGADAAATTTRTDAGGRTAWFGFQLSHVASAADSARLDRMVQNGILWAAGRPIASVQSWPNGKQSALVLAEDVEAEYRNAYGLARLLRELDAPGSFFVVSHLVEGDPDLARVLLDAGEVGSHTSDHTPLQGLGAVDQRVRLRRAWDETRDWAGVGPVGLRPPEETFDTHTFRGWEEAGGTYLLATNQARSAAPEIYGQGRRSLVLVPRVIKDDYNVFVQDGALRASRLTEAFLDGMAKVRAIGGIATVVVHTQIVGTGQRLEAIRAVVDTARAQGDWWIARADEVAGWWRSRTAVNLTLSRASGAGPGRTPPIPESAEGRGESSTHHAAQGDEALVLEVHGPAEKDLHGLGVEIFLPHGPQGVLPEVNGTPVPYAETPFGIRVSLGDLKAGEVRRILLRPNVDTTDT